MRLTNNDVGIGRKFHANRLDLDHSWASARVYRITLTFPSCSADGQAPPGCILIGVLICPRKGINVMSLSQLARSIRESATLKLNETAALLRDKGEPIIHLGGGEPKSKAPIDAVINCAALLNTGEIRYTAPDGIPALKKGIIRYTEEHYKKIVSADNVIASGGAKQALMVLLHALLDPKEEVIFPAPYWVSYPEMVKLAGGVPVPVTAEDGSFCPTVKEMADACGSYTKAIILNSPNNPSGAMYSNDFVQEMVEFCEKRSIYLIMDDIYNRLVFDGKSAPIAYDFMKSPLEQSKLVVINGVSKMYAMTGFRIGWPAAHTPLAPRRSTAFSAITSSTVPSATTTTATAPSTTPPNCSPWNTSATHFRRSPTRSTAAIRSTATTLISAFCVAAACRLVRIYKSTRRCPSAGKILILAFYGMAARRSVNTAASPAATV